MDNQPKIVMYSTQWCGDCVRSKKVFDKLGIAFKEVDIIEDTGVGAWITGLETISTIITVGQDYVSQGEKVGIALDTRFDSLNERIN